MENVLESYLVRLGFDSDEPAFRKLTGLMGQAESLVSSSSKNMAAQVMLSGEKIGGAAGLIGEKVMTMAKFIVQAEGTVVGAFVGISAAIVGVVDKAAMADQGYRLMGQRMLMTTDSARKLDMVTKALGVTLEEAIWDPELHSRAVQMSEDIDRWAQNRSPNFEKNMEGIRDIHFQFSRLGNDFKLLQMNFASDLFAKLFPKGDAVERLRKFADEFLVKIPKLSDALSNMAIPVLKSTWQMFAQGTEVMKGASTVFTNFIGLMSGDTSIVNSEFSFERLAHAIEHVENALTAMMKAMTDAEGVMSHSTAAIGALMAGNTKQAREEAGKATEQVNWGSGIMLGAGSLWAGKKAAGAVRWIGGAARGLFGGSAAAEAMAGGAEVAAGSEVAAGAAGAAEAAGGGLLATLGPWGLAIGAGIGANWLARKFFPQFEKWEDTNIYDPVAKFFGGGSQSPGHSKPVSDSASLQATKAEIEATADKYGVPRPFLLALAQQESGFNQSARSNKGAIGVMQLTSGTAKDLGVDPNDVHQNIEGGGRYASQLLQRYHGDFAKAAAAYNAGPGRVDRASGLEDLPSETRAYVPSVMELMNRYSQPQPAAAQAGTESAMVQVTPASPVSYAEGQVPSWFEKMPSWMSDTPAWYHESPDWMKNSPTFRQAMAADPVPQDSRLARLASWSDIPVRDDGGRSATRPMDWAPVLAYMQQPVAAAVPSVTNVHSPVDYGGIQIYITQPGADANQIRRAVQEGIDGAQKKQIQFDLAQLSPAY